ncbi:hypothetical protein L1889_18215 [Paenalcaligenes niemegkensis]|uniref:hypothetical protein n=1 Tax=Paenalcaligenes niemegkensis TaxID=2895469 RepID=UPI001EE9A34A|nr:hypothetical protein [Paenalcaligenes niemegkensis]MCQ9618375.1 hypothetical protein [Paenalcaligenes niemegkensis]
MALPRWCYDDPAKHVDFIRRKREQHNERQPEAKERRARKELEKLFKKEEGKNV